MIQRKEPAKNRLARLAAPFLKDADEAQHDSDDEEQQKRLERIVEQDAGYLQDYAQDHDRDEQDDRDKDPSNDVLDIHGRVDRDV